MTILESTKTSTSDAPAREVRLRMFLEILAASCGQADASDYRWNWINAFCGEHEGCEPDTFNTAHDAGYTTVSHDSDTDTGTVYLTDAGRAYLSAPHASTFLPICEDAACTGNPCITPPAGTTVLQPWVSGLTFMQQTVLLAAIRGPDGVPKYGPTKMLLRWYRRCILLSAMDQAVLSTPQQPGGGSFTGPSFDALFCSDWRDPMDDIVGAYLRELDAIPHHFQLHLLHAAEILGYKHPDGMIRRWWLGTYQRLVHDMHLWPETEEQMDRRLGDSRDQWLERNDVATID
jgi:hypothetical protein